MYEIILYGRGGQGVVSAGEILGKAAVMDGKWAHSLPFYGTERTSSPVRSYVRIDEIPISMKSYIYNPDAVILFDPTLLGELINVVDGIKRGGILLINCKNRIEMTEKISSAQIYYVDAIDIALKILGRPLISMIMLGAFLKTKEVVKPDSIKKVIMEEFSGEIAKKNVEAVDVAFNDVKRETCRNKNVVGRENDR